MSMVDLRRDHDHVSMVSVRCMRPGLPGGKVITAKRRSSGGGRPDDAAPGPRSVAIEQCRFGPSVDADQGEVAPEAAASPLVRGRP